MYFNQNEILFTYRADFPKYARHHQIKYVHKVFEAIPKPIGRRLKYSKIDADVKSRDLKSALELLVKSQVVAKVKAALGAGLPLEAGCSDKRMKALFLDVGLMQRLVGMQYAQWRDSRDVFVSSCGVFDNLTPPRLLPGLPSPHRRGDFRAL